MVKECRRRTGPDFPIFFRYSQWKIQDYGARLATTPQELAGLVEALTDAGVHCFHCSTRRFWEPEFAGSDLNLAGWTKKLSGLPTITVGSISLDKELVPYTIRRQVKDEKAKDTSITNLNRVMEMFDRGDFDMIAVGRAMLANPDWTNLVRAGRMDLLQPYDADSLALIHRLRRPGAAAEPGPLTSFFRAAMRHCLSHTPRRNRIYRRETP